MNRQDLLERITEWLENDERVRGLWVIGSTARGTDDEFSDLDLVAVLADHKLEEFVAGWPALVERSLPLVFHQTMTFGRTTVFNQVVGEDWLRFDLTAGPEDVLRGRSRRTARVVFDRDGLDATLPPTGPIAGPSPEVVGRLVPEFLRVAALLPVALGRRDYVVAASGSTLLRTMLIQLMVESVEVEDRGGALHLSTLLTPEHFHLVESLPPIAATRESAIAVQQACLDAFLPLARDLCHRTAVPWPTDFANAVHRRLAPYFAEQPPR
ncbi:hypothetical protein Kfla_6218 [Kribbella flavida DSM 17836]|uniref:DNA polymerase beta domain protein region n=1 Tax=Kribbella flavida (strain DSM 17836 / JCM 10339 / NBRC 14399) TaxID=479435 RepID=D2PVI1_KRIFD|nr:aminoglycoside 6-adenylyltransferase [Kribbella flavida]ADB35221.1 hypothetical protein Kfla_6218 [Kribbella flavida DSM 17836]